MANCISQLTRQGLLLYFKGNPIFKNFMYISSMKKNSSRRSFLYKTGFAAAGFYILPRHVFGRGFTAPSDKLLVAAIGIGGFAETELIHLFNTGKTEIAFLCDVDDRQAENSRARFPKAKFYKDYRLMLQHKTTHFDAVMISSPNHMHAPQCMAAMQLNKHIFIQQPLSHTLQEGRMLRNAALHYKVVTQINNTHNSNGIHKLMHWQQANLIGDIHTIYCSTNRSLACQGIGWPKNTSSIPSQLDWNLWQGVAPAKDYINGLLPTNWRAWWHYGNGVLGDMAQAILGPVFALLNLGLPLYVECMAVARYHQPFTPIGYPDSSPLATHLVFTFEGKAGMPNIVLHWMDGGFQSSNGIHFIGTKGKMVCGAYGDAPQLIPASKSMEFSDDSIENSESIMDNTQHKLWVEAAIAGFHSPQSKALKYNFENSATLNECIHLGNMAIRSYDLQQKNRSGNKIFPDLSIRLNWDQSAMRVTNFDDANQFIKKDYRLF
ncbi:MAG: gfo/Idh/MocA family oxidoreductase [Sphingobacteriia bacterium]|nr:MAG: gfo/Idh/MocA family oxidoreductase [Sphingobacteriia bacterium]